MAETGESEVFLEKDFLNFEGLLDKVLTMTITFKTVVDEYTSYYAATKEKHDPKNSINNDKGFS